MTNTSIPNLVLFKNLQSHGKELQAFMCELYKIRQNCSRHLEETKASFLESGGKKYYILEIK